MRKGYWIIAGVAVLAIGALLLIPVVGPTRCMDSWLVTVSTPGGDIPFGLTITDSGDATIRNIVAERIPVEASQHDNGLMINFPHYDSSITLTKNDDGSLSGVWRKVRGDSVAELPAHAQPKSSIELFPPSEGEDRSMRFDGRWRIEFDSSEDVAIGEFHGWGDNDVTGTILTTTGDYRFLEGRSGGALMRLSTFDGAHAFLFHARLQSDGTIAGDFWSGDWWHDTWTATRDDDAQLPDMFAQTSAVSEEALDDLVFTNLEGDPTRVVDALNATNAPARIIEVFGTWCPNCADAGRELAALKDEYGDNLGILGLAFELTDDHQRSSAQVKRYLERFGADWDVLIAGLSNKDAATKELAILDRVRAYPTTIFLNSDNEIVEIHTGFTGPVTGDAYTEQHDRYVSIIESLIHGD